MPPEENLTKPLLKIQIKILQNTSSFRYVSAFGIDKLQDSLKGKTEACS